LTVISTSTSVAIRSAVQCVCHWAISLSTLEFVPEVEFLYVVPATSTSPAIIPTGIGARHWLRSVATKGITVLELGSSLLVVCVVHV
jgi:hypothetical protein